MSGAQLERVAVTARHLCVLLVEDSGILAERLRETVLSVPGVELVGTVDCEADAVELLRRVPVDVVVLDLHLRQGTGFGVLRALRQERRDAVVSIVLSNYDLAEYRRAATALGAEYFLDKLHEFERLPRILQQLGANPLPPPGENSGSHRQPQ